MKIMKMKMKKAISQTVENHTSLCFDFFLLFYHCEIRGAKFVRGKNKGSEIFRLKFQYFKKHSNRVPDIKKDQPLIDTYSY